MWKRDKHKHGGYRIESLNGESIREIPAGELSRRAAIELTKELSKNERVSARLLWFNPDADEYVKVMKVDLTYRLSA